MTISTKKHYFFNNIETHIKNEHAHLHTLALIAF